jgi:hypothetical protein
LIRVLVCWNSGFIVTRNRSPKKDQKESHEMSVPDHVRDRWILRRAAAIERTKRAIATAIADHVRRQPTQAEWAAIHQVLMEYMAEFSSAEELTTKPAATPTMTEAEAGAMIAARVPPTVVFARARAALGALMSPEMTSAWQHVLTRLYGVLAPVWPRDGSEDTEQLIRLEISIALHKLMMVLHKTSIEWLTAIYDEKIRQGN